MRLLLLLTIFFGMFFTVACSSKHEANTSTKPIPTNEKDLGIGDSPTPPPNLKIPDENSRSLFMQEGTMDKPSIENAANARIDKNVSNQISIMSSSGGVLTLWALNPGNWVWGYPPSDAFEFGKAQLWRVISFENNQVMIRNEAKNTCLQAYRNGVVHEVCDKNLDTQLWTFNLFDNQAVQVQNVGTKTCLQTPTFRHTNYYSIYMTEYAMNTSNLDQQWYIIPTLVNTAPIFTVK